MRVLATAHPNKNYTGIYSIRDMVLEARLINNKVHYFETHTNNPNWVVELKESLVFSLFPLECGKYDAPFQVNSNKKFWTVMNRENWNFKPLYLKLKHDTAQQKSLS